MFSNGSVCGSAREEEAAEPSGVWLRKGRQKRGAETKGAMGVFFIDEIFLVSPPFTSHRRTFSWLASFLPAAAAAASLSSFFIQGRSRATARATAEDGGEGRGGAGLCSAETTHMCV